MVKHLRKFILSSCLLNQSNCVSTKFCFYSDTTVLQCLIFEMFFRCEKCNVPCKSQGGLKRHTNIIHHQPPSASQPPHFPSPDPNNFRMSPPPNPPSPFSSRRSPRRCKNGSPVWLPWSSAPINLQKYGTKTETHAILDGEFWKKISSLFSIAGFLGTPCDSDGYDLDDPSSPPPPPIQEEELEDYSPFGTATEFELAEFLYNRVQMSGRNVDILSKLLNRLMLECHCDSLWMSDHNELYSLIDEIHQGDINWESFTVKYNGELPEDISPVPAWKLQGYEVWFRDPLKILEQMLSNPSYKLEFDISPKKIFRNGKRLYRDLMTGNWAWFQCVCCLLVLFLIID
jgi:hypothetical protein